VKQGLGTSVACVRVRAKHRRHGHGSDTKLMACTRQGNKERGTARNGPAVLVGDIRQRTTSRARASDLTVKFLVKHDGTMGKDQSGEDRPEAPAFRSTAVCVLAMSRCPEKAELWTSGEHERTEGFSPSGVRASVCRTTAVQLCRCRQRAGLGVRSSGQYQHDVKQGARALR
jgi:hypothetical protein